MPESVAVIVSSGGEVAATTALDLIAVATMMDMPVHVYITGDAIRWLRSEEGEVLERLREGQVDGDVKVYACSRGMGKHGIAREALPREVDELTGFAFLLGVASEATVTVNF
jgi:peroxiredoxin family protein